MNKKTTSKAAGFGIASVWFGSHCGGGFATGTLAANYYVKYGAWALFIWPLAFSLPNTLRAAGDVRYTMIVSVVSMWVFRVLLSYVLAWYGLGIKAVWISMMTDWVVRSMLFTARYCGNRWLQKKVV